LLLLLLLLLWLLLRRGAAEEGWLPEATRLLRVVHIGLLCGGGLGEQAGET
jgi:hypothetical protein